MFWSLKFFLFKTAVALRLASAEDDEYIFMSLITEFEREIGHLHGAAPLITDKLASILNSRNYAASKLREYLTDEYKGMLAYHSSSDYMLATEIRDLFERRIYRTSKDGKKFPTISMGVLASRYVNQHDNYIEERIKQEKLIRDYFNHMPKDKKGRTIYVGNASKKAAYIYKCMMHIKIRAI